MDVVQNPQKSSGYDQGTTMRKHMWVVTPICAAAAVVSAVVLRRPTKEYTHRYSHDASQIDYCRYWGRASLPPITSNGLSLRWLAWVETFMRIIFFLEDLDIRIGLVSSWLRQAGGKYDLCRTCFCQSPNMVPGNGLVDISWNSVNFFWSHDWILDVWLYIGYWVDIQSLDF